MNQNKIIELQNIGMGFENDVILDGIDLDIHDNEFMTLLGPSGCGKTTLLRIIAGFITPISGQVLFNGKVINDLPPYKRQVNTIFQRYALFPNYNVFENIAYGLRVHQSQDGELKKRIQKNLGLIFRSANIFKNIASLIQEHKKQEAEIKEQVKEMLRLVNLSGFEKRSIHKLSGGQQQRVAIARALINRPKVLLLDEPLAALDLKLRKDMQNELKNIQKQLGITFVFVTHDQEEALSMSDTVVVLNEGKIQQVGTPIDIYNEPQNAFVADFIGESNILNGTMIDDYKVAFAGKAFVCVDKGFAPREEVDVVIRPEDVDIVPMAEGQLIGQISSVTFRGVHFEFIVDIGGFKWMIQSTDEHKADEMVGLKIDPDAIHIMKKSKYSGQYGDYSSYSDEFDSLNEIAEDKAE